MFELTADKLTHAINNLAKSINSYVTIQITTMSAKYGEAHTKEMVESAIRLKKELDL